MVRVKMQKIDKSIERHIVTQMITNGDFLKKIESIYKPNLIQDPCARMLCDWAMEYYLKYEKAPQKEIQFIAEDHYNEMEEEEEDLIKHLLKLAAREWENELHPKSTDYYLDAAIKHFNQHALLKHCEEVKRLAESGQITEAAAKIANYNKLDKPSCNSLTLGVSEDEVLHALNHAREELFRLPGDFGKMCGPICREDFIGIAGSEKGGKSFMMLEFGVRALKAHCNVAWFDAGDMSAEQIHQRFIAYENGGIFEEGKILLVPILDCAHNQDNSCERKERPCDFGVIKKEGKEKKKTCKKLSFEDAPDYEVCTHCKKEDPKSYKGAHWWKEEKIFGMTKETIAKKLVAKWTKKNAKQIRAYNFPSDELTCDMIGHYLDIAEAEDGFVPDVIIVDYADIMVSVKNTKEERHQINAVWKGLRKLSQTRNAAVITGTQVHKSVFKSGKVEQDSMSEDKRKLGHVTHMIGLAGLPEERDEGIVKANMLVRRHGKYNVHRICYVLQCLEKARGLCGSYFFFEQKE